MRPEWSQRGPGWTRYGPTGHPTLRRALSNDLQTILSELALPLACVRRLDKRAEKAPHFSYTLQSRIHFALASYNVGYGHLLDARRLAREKGWDANVWFGNVEQAMRLLSQPAYYERARYGYCRGGQPVHYVEKIQSLYDAYVEVLDTAQ